MTAGRLVTRPPATLPSAGKPIASEERLSSQSLPAWVGSARLTPWGLSSAIRMAVCLPCRRLSRFCRYNPFPGWSSLLPPVHPLPPEATLDAQVAVGDIVVERRGDLDDLLVLDVDGEGAADAAVGAEGVGGGLGGLVPGACLSHVELALEH